MSSNPVGNATVSLPDKDRKQGLSMWNTDKTQDLKHYSGVISLKAFTECIDVQTSGCSSNMNGQFKNISAFFSKSPSARVEGPVW